MPEFQIEDNRLTAYTGNSHFIEIPDGVKAIGNGAFRDCRELMEITIPDSVKEICSEAFHLCVNLRKIIGGNGVTRIEKDAFTGTAWYKYYSENETEWKEDFAYVGKVLVKARRNLREAYIPEG
ncbi:MAG: leucine-rich repeat domain-containing protein, partial [Lachnospiraceae bacterium]|nr:leucine-rich repeat domain-containing protein [Lachnospiraceae bacterium]